MAVKAKDKKAKPSGDGERASAGQAEERSGDRRTELLNAGLRVIARDGMRGLTHRAVENEAGVPHGSTTYYFGTRYDLLAALSVHMRETDRQLVEPIAHQMTLLLADRSQEFDLSAMAAATVAWVQSNPELQLARYEMQLAGARDPQLKELMTDCAVTFRRMIEPIVVSAGSKQPERHARMVQSMVDGLVLDWLTHTDGDPELIADGLERVLGTFAE